jgi:hypothetical protein
MEVVGFDLTGMAWNEEVGFGLTGVIRSHYVTMVDNKPRQVDCNAIAVRPAYVSGNIVNQA